MSDDTNTESAEDDWAAAMAEQAASGEGIATRATVANVVATLHCGAANSTARVFTSPTAPLDTAGNFRISGVLTEVGTNPAVMPATCVSLCRSNLAMSSTLRCLNLRSTSRM